MEASIIDLRYRMREVLKAIERREAVVITYRGKPKARLEPLVPMAGEAGPAVDGHPFFGMGSDVDPSLDGLRGGRYDVV